MFRDKTVDAEQDKQAGLHQGLSRTQSGLFSGLSIFRGGKKKIDTGFIDDLEERLLQADVGIKATSQIIDILHDRVKRSEVGDLTRLRAVLHKGMQQLLQPMQQELQILIDNPLAILLTGVNGVGKTTTAGKLANYFAKQGCRTMLAAADTFRAAAIEQLQTWGKNYNIPVITQRYKTDPSAVIFDALQSAKANAIDILVIDTAGRLHTQNNLMNELKKMHRTVKKFDSYFSIKNLLVLDASTGQNALSQARLFHEAIGISGLVLTKLDGTAKGGVIFALTQETRLPIYFIGVGEKADDLKVFNAANFVDALLAW